MPLNESRRRTRRDEWPIEFDLEGIPQDRKVRKQLLELKRRQIETDERLQMTQNNFAVDKLLEVLTPEQRAQLLGALQQDAPTGREFDLSKPPVSKQYRHQEFPKMVYNHDTGHVLTVQNKQQLAAAENRNYQRDSSPDHDYSRLSPQNIAPRKLTANREDVQMTAEQLLALEEAEAAEAALRANGGASVDEGTTEPEPESEPEQSGADEIRGSRRSRRG